MRKLKKKKTTKKTPTMSFFSVHFKANRNKTLGRDISSPQHGAGREGALRGWKGLRCAGPRGPLPSKRGLLIQESIEIAVQKSPLIWFS